MAGETGACVDGLGETFAKTGFLPAAMPLAQPSILPALNADAPLYRRAVLAQHRKGRARVPYFTTPAVAAVARDPAIIAVVTKLLASEAWVMWGANIQEDTPNAADAWHVDLESWFWPSITVVVGLAGCTPDNATRLIPGSHRLSYTPAELPDAGDDATVFAAARASAPGGGDIARITDFGNGRFYAFNARTWHRGDHAASLGRRSLFLHYQRASEPRIPDMKDYERHLFFRRAAAFMDGSPAGAPPANRRVYGDPYGRRWRGLWPLR